MFWNARDLRDSAQGVVDYMVESKVDVAFFAETRTYDSDLSQGIWKWLAGTEKLPLPGDSAPRLGMGAFVNMNKFPGASVAKTYERSMWLRLPGKHCDLFVCSVHLPLYSSPREREKVITEVQEGYEKFKDRGTVLFGGDFNSRCGLNGDTVLGQSGRQLFDFCKLNSLTIVNDMECCTGEYTRVEDVVVNGVTVTRRSTIDYTLVPTADKGMVVDLHIDDNSGLDSDHRPLLLKVAWERLLTERSKHVAKSHRSWKVHSMTPSTWNKYEDLCEEEMVPWIAVANEIRDGPPMPDAQASQMVANVLSDTFLYGLTSAAEHGVGSKQVSADSKPWVDAELSSLFKLRRLSRSVCLLAKTTGNKDAIEHTSSTHEDISKLTRSSVRLKRIERNDKDMRSIESSPLGSKLFWTRWKARLRSNGKNSAPECAVDEDGELVTDHLAVLKVWKDYVYQLGKETIIPSDPGDSASNKDSEYDDAFAREILDTMQNCKAENGVPELDMEVKWAEVHAAVRGLKNGKAPGLDGIPPELLFNGGMALEVALTELFNFMWTHTVWPDEWRVAVLIPLYKGDGSKLDPQNHRMLAMMSVIAKLFEKVLDTRLREWSERVGMLSDLQGGFRKARGTVDQMFILNEVIAMRWREARLPLFLTFIDVRKAYDRVWRPGLWYKLRQAGVTGRMLDMLREMYRSVSRRVLINGSSSEVFTVEAGVPQGAVLSPLLYAVYINGLHDALRKLGLGVRVCGRLVPLLLYADDIVLLSKDEDETRRMHDVVTEYARKWRFDVNQNKTKLVVFGPNKTKSGAKTATWRISNKAIEVAEYYKYLGAEIGGVRGKWNKLIERLHGNTTEHLNLILWQGGGRYGLRARTLAHQWKTTCRPKAEYACELWEGEVSNALVKKLESIQTTFCKATMGFRKSCPAAVAMRMDMTLQRMQTRRQMLKLLYWKKLCTSDPSRLLSIMFRHRHQEVLGGRAKYSWCQAMGTILRDWRYDKSWHSGTCNTDWDSMVRETATARDRHSNAALLATSPSLSIYRTLSQSGQIAPYLDDRSHRKALWLKTALRLGHPWLMERIARILGWPTEGGACVLCGTGSIETISHFLLDCEQLDHHRMLLTSTLRARLSVLGIPGKTVLDKYLEGGAPCVKILLGSDVHFPPCPEAQDSRQYAELCAMAMWTMDKTSRNFMFAAWRHRASIVGTLKVVGGRLVRVPPVSHPGGTPSTSSPQPSPPPTQHKGKRRTGKKGRYNFYKVWEGKGQGVFYKWSDCKAAMKGCPRTGVKGFDSLEEAYATGPPL